jgi:hypothetical protein
VACAGEDSGKALRRWPSSLATRGVVLKQELASGGGATAASRSAAAAAEETEEEERGGEILGSYLQLQELQGLHCETKFPTILKLN